MTELAYRHRFHVGNHADVFKHAGLLALLRALPQVASRTVIETHAGEGSYPLGGTGEWTAGIGRLWAAPPASPPPALAAYLDALKARGCGPRHRYVGSPLLLLDALGPNDRLILHELLPEPADALRQHVGADPRVQVVQADGYLADLPDGPSLLVIDPPYEDRADWIAAADLVHRAASPDRVVALWYPIKSWSRPNVLHSRLRELGADFVATELVVTPIELKRPQLAGSGLLVAGAPAAASTLAALAAALGPALATHDGRWQVRVTGR